MAGETAPNSWIRVQTLVADLAQALVLTGRPVMPVELAATEERILRMSGARVLRDMGGHPCVQPGDPVVLAWQATVNERIARIERDLDAAMEAVKD